MFGSLVDAMLRKLAKTPADEHRLRTALEARVEADKLLEPYGLADWQADNRRLDALDRPHEITEDEFRRVILPALAHIRALPDGDHAARLFAFAGHDWRAASDAVDALMMHCDSRWVRDFVHGVCSAYDVLKRAERECMPCVHASWPRKCPVCREHQPPETSLADDIRDAIAGAMAGRNHLLPGSMDAKSLLAQFTAGRYELAHETYNEDGDLVALCPGPFLTTVFQSQRSEQR